MYLSLFYLFLLRDKHYKAFLVAELTHASGNFFSNQPKLLETLFIGHKLCYLLFPITLLKFWVGVQKAKVWVFGFKSDTTPLNFTFHIFSLDHGVVFVYEGVC